MEIEEIIPYYYSKNPLVKWLFYQRLRNAVMIVKDILGSKKPLKVVDLGFGQGYLFPLLEQYPEHIEIFGIDDEPNTLSVQKDVKRSQIKVGDLRKSGYGAHSFDVAFCLDVLEHFKNLHEPVDEIKRILKPDGTLVISVPTESWIYKLGRLMVAGTTSMETAPCSPHYHRAQDIEIFLEQNGFYKVRKILLPSIPLLSLFHTVRFKRQATYPVRNTLQKIKDFITFPLRVVSIFDYDKFGLSALRSERFEYVAKEVKGYCLDVGCGMENLFIKKYIKGNGKGIDVFEYKGLTQENLVKDITHFPFNDATFDSVTFIANFHHIPKSQRDAELKEAWRCLKPGGNIIVTMAHPIAEFLIHQLIFFYYSVFGIYNMDSHRGMHEEEELYVKESEIIKRLTDIGFRNIKKKYFGTQWGINRLFVAEK